VTSTTSDTNFAAYLVSLDHAFTHSVDTSTGRPRVLFSFSIPAARFRALLTEFLNSEIQHFVEVQKRMKNVVRLALD
jgi:hypothetical protein